LDDFPIKHVMSDKFPKKGEGKKSKRTGKRLEGVRKDLGREGLGRTGKIQKGTGRI